MKTCRCQQNKTPKKGGEKCIRRKDPSLGKKKKITNEGKPQGEQEQIKYSPPCPPIARNIVDKKKVETPEKTHSLEEPSPTITTQLKIEATYACYNTVCPFASKTNAKLKEEGL
jgi:hypothetical protein